METHSREWAPSRSSVAVAWAFAIFASSVGIAFAAFGASASRWTSEDWSFAGFSVILLLEYLVLFGLPAAAISAGAMSLVQLMLRRVRWPAVAKIGIASIGIFVISGAVETLTLPLVYNLPLPLPGDPQFIVVAALCVQAVVSVGVAVTLSIERSMSRSRGRW